MKQVALAAGLMLAASGCMAYRGPIGVEDALERSLGADLHREVGIKLGPISTQLVASFSSDGGDFELRDVTSIGVAVYEIAPGPHENRKPLKPSELGGSGWTTMLDARDHGDQVILLAKPKHGTIREMLLLAVDDDEVVVARLTGRLDRLIAHAMEATRRDGARGARAAIGQSTSPN